MLFIIFLGDLPSQAVLSAFNWLFAAQAHAAPAALVAPVGQAERFGKKKSFSF